MKKSSNGLGKKICVTTSWDDGHILDIRLASLLKKYGIEGTFYISPRNVEFNASDLLNDDQIKALSKEFEIGAHTFSHQKLNTLIDSEAAEEINKSKEYLETIFGKKVESFCYPGGFYNLKNVRQVKKAGFKLARTTKTFSFSVGVDPYEMPTSLHVYDHWSDAWQVAKFVKFNPVAFYRCYRHWDVLAKYMFDQVLTNGGVFHMWGHSWEIDKHNDWNRLEKVLSYISGRQNVLYTTNGGLL